MASSDRHGQSHFWVESCKSCSSCLSCSYPVFAFDLTLGGLAVKSFASFVRAENVECHETSKTP